MIFFTVLYLLLVVIILVLVFAVIHDLKDTNVAAKMLFTGIALTVALMLSGWTLYLHYLTIYGGV